ncbi:TIR domain-containing protein [Corynebacterium sanguinis]|uniref:TIR domain-containing protein n=1 Tax=Corynebacterium sanguinis TaxID=2594913 RepID=UPI0021A6743F|nr:TIR domain-containing protein [Corynebacterium sanguinis]MCT2252628.1 TIR domain-containing protein [Corynebacterium sanguinis]
MAKSVFYSFHYDNDVHRVQLVRQIDALTGAPEITGQNWEQVRYKTETAIQNWIDKEMNYKKAVIVLIGRKTAERHYVQYEIERAWSMKKPLLGVRIHGLASLSDGADSPGEDPFEALGINGVPVFDPTQKDWYTSRIDTKATFNELRRQLPSWADQGVVRWS